MFSTSFSNVRLLLNPSKWNLLDWSGLLLFERFCLKPCDKFQPAYVFLMLPLSPTEASVQWYSLRVKCRIYP